MTIYRAKGFTLISIQLYPELERGRNTKGMSECVTIGLFGPTQDA